MSTAVVIDVREPDEFARGHVKDALNIPLGLLMHDADKLKDMPKNAKILVYCRTGRRSGDAMRYLMREGYINVTNGINQSQMESKFLK
jgi:phage shock protein E